MKVTFSATPGERKLYSKDSHFPRNSFDSWYPAQWITISDRSITGEIPESLNLSRNNKTLMRACWVAPIHLRSFNENHTYMECPPGVKLQVRGGLEGCPYF